MESLLERLYFKAVYTIGCLSVDGTRLCATLEATGGGKVANKALLKAMCYAYRLGVCQRQSHLQVPDGCLNQYIAEACKAVTCRCCPKVRSLLDSSGRLSAAEFSFQLNFSLKEMNFKVFIYLRILLIALYVIRRIAIKSD